MLQKHGLIGGTLMLFRVARLFWGKLFRSKMSAAGEQLVSLGDGGFGSVQGPDLALATPSSTGNGQPGHQISLIQIQSAVQINAAPAGHFGDPHHPNG